MTRLVNSGDYGHGGLGRGPLEVLTELVAVAQGEKMEPVLTAGNDAEEGADVGVPTGQGLVIEKFQRV